MATSSFLHPSLGFLVLAVILPFLPGRQWKWLLLIPPVIALWSVFTMTPGVHAVLPYLGEQVILGRVDRLSLIFAQVFAVMSLIGMTYALNVPDKGSHIAASLYVAGSFGSVFAGDYLSLFVFWELMSIGSTFLIFLNRSRESTLAGFRYFLFHTVGGLFLLGGLLLRHQATGSFAFDHIPADGAALYDWLILIGFCVNAAVVPLHAWLPDAYPRATVAGAVFMCAFTTKTAVYVLARGFAGWEILAVAGAVMAVYGVGHAIIANSARRILAYDIISQVGYMAVGIGVGTAMTLDGAAAHAYAHILYKSLLFMSIGCLIQGLGTDRLEKLGGLASRLPWITLFFTVGSLSISGMPLFNGFVTKTMTIAGTAAAHHTAIALALEVATVGTFIAVGIRLPYFVFWRRRPADAGPEPVWKPLPWNMYAGMALAAVLCIAQGVHPDMLYHFLPYAVDVPYEPWAAWNVLQALLLLGFAGLATYLLRGLLVTHPGVNLDFDYFYRLIGKALLFVICRPIAWIDGLWSEVYRVIGLNALKVLGWVSAWFDRSVIDCMVDGSAITVSDVGRLGAKLQSGNLQNYLAMTGVLFLLIFGLVWYLG
ncbi:Na(+)/H(+) antiporter subunit D [Telmatospirillum siberiense]|uniref:Na(+)/H(+) antiporter subunit D n=1 Tax=Telmatospirillum siberiense TaxID=382514 RepID=A0A2N3Q0H2_9PROT|nr:Na(+)/H(+) antiporter subunit D [Telmatospirillum siberiense]PKU26144.1 Na(+)/H(+) antiporter subunit D [Telmatospirillum siberiense]